MLFLSVYCVLNMFIVLMSVLENLYRKKLQWLRNPKKTKTKQKHQCLLCLFRATVLNMAVHFCLCYVFVFVLSHFIGILILSSALSWISWRLTTPKCLCSHWISVLKGLFSQHSSTEKDPLWTKWKHLCTVIWINYKIQTTYLHKHSPPLMGHSYYWCRRLVLEVSN